MVTFAICSKIGENFTRYALKGGGVSPFGPYTNGGSNHQPFQDGATGSSRFLPRWVNLLLFSGEAASPELSPLPKVRGFTVTFLTSVLCKAFKTFHAIYAISCHLRPKLP